MSLARTLLLAIALFVVLAGPPSTAAASPSQAQVMIVGVSHFVSRRDVHNSKFTDSPLSSKRQVQIADIVRRIDRFHPTKVLIEITMGSPVVTERYRRYLRGHYTLPADEPYQLGFKLAKLARDRTIYPIDTFGPELLNDDRRIDIYLKSHFNSVNDARFDAYLARDNALEQHGTYLDVLRNLNTDESIHANASWNSVFDGMGRASDDAGAAYVSQWYARNCYIYSNILSVLSPADRAVVIIGQGHEYLLREFIRLNPNLRDVNPLHYLND